MICSDCREAADQQAGREAHCETQGGPDAACFCQHRTDRYRKPRPAAAEAAVVVVHVHPDPPHIAAEIRDLRRYSRGRR